MIVLSNSTPPRGRARKRRAMQKAARGISFEEIVLAVEEGGLRDFLAHPNQKRYPGQVVLVVVYRKYVFLVPSIEEEEHYFLKTVIPSRKATRNYLETEDPNEKS